jgi:hypothetical protein
MFDGGRLFELVTQVVLKDAQPEGPRGRDLASLTKCDAVDTRVLSPNTFACASQPSLKVRLSFRRPVSRPEPVISH